MENQSILTEEERFCKCGCGREIEIKLYHKYYGIPNYIQGHNMVEETKRKISNTLKEKFRKGEKIVWTQGKQLSERHKKNISLGRRGKYHSKKTKKLMSILAQGKNNSFYGKHHTEESIKKMLKGLMKRPTSFERKIIDLCSKNNLPFKYVGNGEVLIGYKNPDFIETNGRKLLIEVYNNFHHQNDYENKRREHFKKYGYDTIFIGEEEVLADNWEEICLNKINEVLIKNEK